MNWILLYIYESYYLRIYSKIFIFEYIENRLRYRLEKYSLEIIF